MPQHQPCLMEPILSNNNSNMSNGNGNNNSNSYDDNSNNNNFQPMNIVYCKTTSSRKQNNSLFVKENWVYYSICHMHDIVHYE